MPSEDPRVVEARAEHKAAQEAKAADFQHRAKRDQLIRELWAGGGWTQQGIADAVGCSEGLVRIALKRS